MPALLTHIIKQLPALSSRLTIALSGGLDSVVLLHLLCRAREIHDLELNAIHIHHGLSPNADSWQAFCAQLCAAWNVPFQVQKVQLNPQGQGVEAAARTARYQAFAQLGAQTVALAHHNNDQIETLLLAILRGGGLRALAAMSEMQTLDTHSGSLKLWRPLLHYSRQDLADYAAKHQLNWIEDESNQDTRYLRNFVRQEWLPQLEARLPNARVQLSASIQALQEDLTLFNEWAAADKAQIYQQHQWHIAPWRELSPARRRQILRQLAHDEQLGTPTRASIHAFANTLAVAESGEWRLPHGRVWLYRQRLVAVSDTLLNSWFWCREPFSGSLKDILQHLGEQSPTFRQPENLLEQHFTLRAAQRKDYLSIRENQHHNVFKLLAQHGVPAPLRPLFPVLTNSDNDIVAVLNLRVCHTWAAYGIPQFLPLEKIIIPKHIAA